MTDEHYNQPAQGTENWDEPLNENFADLGVEVANEVATWSDLPATSEVTQSSDGQWPVYRVEADDVFAGSPTRRRRSSAASGVRIIRSPESHHEAINTDDLSTVYDRRISTTSQLENLPSDIQAGETVAIQQPDTPYRPESWSSGGKYAEIDVSNFEILCESPYAKNWGGTHQTRGR